MSSARGLKTSYDALWVIHTLASTHHQLYRERHTLPRVGALGGCTAHNVVYFAYAHRSDFEAIANLTSHDSWLHANMSNRHFGGHIHPPQKKEEKKTTD